MESVSKHLLVPALGLQAVFFMLGKGEPHPNRLPEWLPLLLASFLLYLYSAWRVLDLRPSSSRLLLILGAALVFRLTAWTFPVFLSDDAYRYRWEARVQAEGGNPYTARPDDPRWKHLLDHDLHLIPAADRPAGYGPVLELVQRWMWPVAARLGDGPHEQARWFRLPAALFDLLAMAALLALLRVRGLPAERVLIYAWCPLVVVEFWGMGHNDAVLVCLTVCALWLAACDRWVWSFGALTLAAFTKFWPAALFPIFIGWDGRRPMRPWQWLVAAPVALLVSAPYLGASWREIEENARHMSGFVGGWRNNDSLYGLLLWLTGDQYRAKYAAFALIAMAVLWVTLRRWPLERAALAVASVLLLVSANCHPWYLTWLVPLLAIHPFAPLFLWTALMPLAYEVLLGWHLLGEWQGSTPGRWLIYGPVFAMLAVSAVLARRRAKLSEDEQLSR